MSEGKYFYCIIGSNASRNFGPIGIGGRGDEAATISCEGISAVISSTPMTKYVLSRDNLIAHQKVIEKVMEEFTVLPVRFCTIANNPDEIRDILGKRQREFKNLLKDMDGKIELGLKAFWKDMQLIYKEIGDNPEIKMRKAPARHGGPVGRDEKIGVGKLVEELLENKKEEEADLILDHLRKNAYEIAQSKLIHERMFLNAAFLVDKARELEFDNLVDDLDKKYKDRMQFKYTGPLPPYNFVNIVIKEGV